MGERNTTMITCVKIKDFRSIKTAEVPLTPLTVLVGRNGSGKSNFVDALRFVADALNLTLPTAMEKRGGPGAVRRKNPRGHPTHFVIRVEGEAGNGETRCLFHYVFDVKALKPYGFEVAHEECKVAPCGGPLSPLFFKVENGQFETSVSGVRPSTDATRLTFPAIGGQREFAPVFQLLTRMRFYTMSPDALRELQKPDEGSDLKSDGSNLASVVRELSRSSPKAHEALCEHLSQVVPGIQGVAAVPKGNMLTMSFKQSLRQDEALHFEALNMSDGTLRVLGLLAASYLEPCPSLIALEEPEATIHPGALATLTDALKEASTRTQVLLTTHSPELLDQFKGHEVDLLRAVELRDGMTTISAVAPHTRQLVYDGLFRAGELLKANGLDSDEPVDRQTGLFEL
ncbi:MAG: chromosome segregation protein SMC [Planctomycetes bacterium]|nr:chromosome segregation protein SMC [Planctomycetota bacterium]